MTSNIIPNSKGKDEVWDLSFLPALKHIMATPENPFFTSEDCILFNKNKTVLIRYPERRQGSYIIPRLVIAIGHKAFANCTGLSAVTIPDSVFEIGSYAFAGCTGLTAIAFPNSLRIIDSYAFAHCSGLSDVIIPDSVVKVGYCAFNEKEKVTKKHPLDNLIWLQHPDNPFYTSKDGKLTGKNL